MNRLLLILLPFFLGACGGGYNPDKALLGQAQKIGDTAYYDLGGNRWRVADALNSVQSGANFQLRFELQDHGTVTLHAFSDADLQGGFELKFERDHGVLKVFANAQGITQEWSSYFSSVNPTQPITLTTDIHNHENPAHVLIWSGAKNNGLNHTNTLYNTAEDSVDLNFAGSPGNGRARAWGVSFTDATISEAIVSSPQETHE